MVERQKSNNTYTINELRKCWTVIWHREIKRITNETVEQLKGMWGVTGHLRIKDRNAQTQTGEDLNNKDAHGFTDDQR